MLHVGACHLDPSSEKHRDASGWLHFLFTQCCFAPAVAYAVVWQAVWGSGGEDSVQVVRTH